MTSINTSETLKLAKHAFQNNDLDSAIDLSMQILEADSENAPAHAIAFSSLYRAGRLEEARRIGGKAAELNPGSAAILNNQACLQLEAKQPAAASMLLKKLLQTHGESAQWLYNLGLAQNMAGGLQKSYDVFNRVLDYQANHDKALFQLANISKKMGRIEDANRQLNLLRVLRNQHSDSHAAYIVHAAHNGLISRPTLHQELRMWAAKFIPQTIKYQIESIADKKKLCIGFIVGDLPVDWWQSMVAPLINQLSKKDKTVVYWQLETPVSPGLAAGINLVMCSSMSDAEFAKRIRSDRADVVVDITGMRRGNRQRVLGLQVASKQFGWLAHEGRYANRNVITIEDQLGKDRFCFTPIQSNPNAIGNRHRTKHTLFASNCEVGLSESSITMLSKIMHQLTEWTLHLDATAPELQNHFRLRFISHGILGARISFEEHLKPTNGSIVIENIVNNDASKIYRHLSRGARAVALRGELFPAQQSAQLLEQIGRSDWIVKNRSQLEHLVLELSEEPELIGMSVKNLDKAGLNNFELFARRFRTILKQDS